MTILPKTNQESVGSDFTHSPVPFYARRPWWRVFSVWVGFIVVVGIMSIGGDMAAGMNRNDLIAAVLLGNAALGILAGLSGYVAAASGKSFAQLCSDVFPGFSAKLVALYAPITLIGWYSIECAIFGGLVGRILGVGDVPARAIMSASAALFCVTTYLGLRGMQWLSLAMVPTIVLLGGYVVSYLLRTGAGSFGFGAHTISFQQGVNLAISSWALGVVAAYPDLARFVRTPRTAALMGVIGIFVFNSANFFIGAAGAVLAKEYDPALILLAAGVPVLALVMAVANVWTTNDANLYSASLGISRALPIGRRPAVLISAAVSVVFAFFNPAQISVFFAFLGFLGTTAPALGGVVLGGYFVVKNGRRPTATFAAWVGWAGGTIASYWMHGVASVPAGFVAGFIVWYGMNRFLTRKSASI